MFVDALAPAAAVVPSSAEPHTGVGASKLKSQRESALGLFVVGTIFHRHQYRVVPTGQMYINQIPTRADASSHRLLARFCQSDPTARSIPRI
eukprot:SAG31_NODE_2538_length_5543_cov_13.884093_4_plen_92_part_00